MKGVKVSNGWATGRAFVLKNDHHATVQSVRKIEKSKVPDNLKKALYYAAEEYVTLKNGLNSKMSNYELLILDFYIAILQEPEYINQIIDLVLHNNESIEEAILKVFSDIKVNFLMNSNHEFADKDLDISSLTLRVCSILNRMNSEILPNGNEQIILVSNNIPFYIFSEMDTSRIAGVISEEGSFSSHSVIYLRSLGIPAVFEVENIIEKIKNGDLLTINGENGEISFSKENFVHEPNENLKTKFSQKDCITKDGKTIKLLGNVNSMAEAEILKANTNNGAGLIRTEFFFMDNIIFPSSYHQIYKYLQIRKACSTNDMVFRLFDLELDKKKIFYKENLLYNNQVDNKELIETQIYALLSSFSDAALYLLIPRVRCREDVLYIKKIISRMIEKMSKKNIRYTKKIRLGIMIETMECVENLDELIDLIDFAALGTNDLCADFHSSCRDDSNQTISACFDPNFLKCVKSVIDKIKLRHKLIYTCGEMASTKEGAYLCCCLGLEAMSLSPSLIPFVRRFLSDIDLSKAKKDLNDLLCCKDAEELINHLIDIIY